MERSQKEAPMRLPAEAIAAALGALQTVAVTLL